MFKKILAMMLCLVMLGAFVACNDAPPAVPSIPEETTKGGGVGVTPGSGTTTPAPESGDAPGWIKVATYNIQHGQDDSATSTAKKYNLDNMVNVIKENNIDICGFNEIERFATRSGKVDQPKYIAEKLTQETGEQYYYAFAAGITGYNGKEAEGGNAIVSRYRIVGTPRTVEIALPENEAEALGSIYERRVLLIVQVEVDGKLLTVISTHFGLSSKEQEKAVDIVENELTSLRNNPVVIMGDFNCTPTKNPITRLKTKMKNTSPGNKVTCPKNNNEIDYIFTSKNMEHMDFQVLQYPYSDHLPVTVKIRLR